MKAWETWDRIIIEADRINDFMNTQQDPGSCFFSLLKGVICLKQGEGMLDHFLPFDFSSDPSFGTLDAWIFYKKKWYRYWEGTVRFPENIAPEIAGKYTKNIIEIPTDRVSAEKPVDEVVARNVYFGLYGTMILMEHGGEIVEKEVERIERPPSTSKKRKPKRRPRTLDRTVYTINLTSTASKRIFQRHTEAWTVKGHWRTLKSGKRTRVRPYVKGDPSKLDPSTYNLLKKENT